MDVEPKSIDSIANDWVVREQSRALTREERRELDSWLGADSRHRGAHVRARVAWLHTNRLTAFAARETPPSVIEDATPRRRWLPAAAAAAAVLIIAGTLVYRSVSHVPGPVYASEIGEVRNIVLVDGSKLTLNTNSQATVHYSDEQRFIDFARGEALFDVMPDPKRPFIVQAKDIKVTAVGTAFIVRMEGARTDIVVTHGVVEVRRPDMPLQRIMANQRVTLTSEPDAVPVQAVAPEAVDRELAWRQGKLSFAGEPLSTAAAQINRYSRIQIHVDDATLAARPVIGVFNANDAEGFAAGAAVTFGAKVEHVDDAIYLRPAD